MEETVTCTTHSKRQSKLISSTIHFQCLSLTNSDQPRHKISITRLPSQMALKQWISDSQLDFHLIGLLTVDKQLKGTKVLTKSKRTAAWLVPTMAHLWLVQMIITQKLLISRLEEAVSSHHLMEGRVSTNCRRTLIWPNSTIHSNNNTCLQEFHNCSRIG
jgi:hypothetical protein